MDKSFEDTVVTDEETGTEIDNLDFKESEETLPRNFL
jgi:hypothetical protein